MAIHLISSVKDEGPFLLEWIAHHKVVGFDRIMIAYNDCTDGSDELLQKLAEHGEIEIFENIVDEGQKPQLSSYQKLYPSEFVQSANAISILDADEFLNIHIGDGKIQTLIETLPKCDVLAMSWKCFGDDGHEKWDDMPICERFTNAIEGSGIGNRGVKSITFDPKNFAGLTNHHPADFHLDRKLIFANGSGQFFEYPNKFVGNEIYNLRELPPEQIGHELVQVNHYATKSLDSFCLRVARGRGAMPPISQRGIANENLHHNLDYFLARNIGANSQDHSISRYFEKRQEEEVRILSLSGVAKINKNIKELYKRRLQFVQNMLDDDCFDMLAYQNLDLQNIGSNN